MIASRRTVPAVPGSYGRFRLEQRVATSGIAETFATSDPAEPGVRRLLHLLKPQLTSEPDFVEAFFDEASRMREVDHPHVLKVREAGEFDGSVFLVTDHVDGKDLRAVYNQAYRLRQSIPIALSVRLVADAARGLAHAHAATADGQPLSIAHRDVAPQNIVASTDGLGIVRGFVLASTLHRVARLRGKVLKGRPSYTAPEHYAGLELDHRTDMFVLGVILYEMTTGQRLFKRGSESEARQAVLAGIAIEPSRVVFGYPGELTSIIRRCISTDPRRRPQNAHLLADELEAFLEQSRAKQPRSDIADFVDELFRPAAEDDSGWSSKRRALSLAPAPAPVPVAAEEPSSVPEVDTEPAGPPIPSAVEAEPRHEPASTQSPSTSLQEIPVASADGDRPKRPRAPGRATVPVAGVDDALPDVREAARRSRPAPSSSFVIGALMAAVVVAVVVAVSSGASTLLSGRDPQAAPSAPKAPKNATQKLGGASEVTGQAASPSKATSSGPEGPPAPEPGPLGELKLVVLPWAEVVIDGKKLGLSPIGNQDLAAGEHDVELTNPDLRRRWRGRVRIQPERLKTVRIDLEKVGKPF